MFGVELGSEIIFPIARAGGNVAFSVKGFYEDPFMGSSCCLLSRTFLSYLQIVYILGQQKTHLFNEFKGVGFKSVL